MEDFQKYQQAETTRSCAGVDDALTIVGNFTKEELLLIPVSFGVAFLLPGLGILTRMGLVVLGIALALGLRYARTHLPPWFFKDAVWFLLPNAARPHTFTMEP